MIPTSKLRFVMRFQHAIGNNYGGTIRILQQWWAIEREGQITPEGEWRDVPLEKEQ